MTRVDVYVKEYGIGNQLAYMIDVVIFPYNQGRSWSTLVWHDEGTLARNGKVWWRESLRSDVRSERSRPVLR